MSVETLSPPTSSCIDRVLRLTPSALMDEFRNIVNATTPADVGANHRGFRDVAAPFLCDTGPGDTDVVSAIDLQAGAIENLRRKRDQLLEVFMERPAVSLRSEFLQMQMLFEGRTITRSFTDGSRVSEYCTMNAERESVDYFMRHFQGPDGTETWQVDKVFELRGTLWPVTVTLRDGDLRIFGHVYRKGHSEDFEIVREDFRHEILTALFRDTIRASAVQFERTPAQIDAHNLAARQAMLSDS